MTPDEKHELVLIARHFHVLPHDALFVRPAWEIDLLAESVKNLEERDH